MRNQPHNWHHFAKPGDVVNHPEHGFGLVLNISPGRDDTDQDPLMACVMFTTDVQLLPADSLFGECIATSKPRTHNRDQSNNCVVTLPPTATEVTR